jgi:5-methylcytosine-specific restriction endonuclease McrBC regulatory subunit McrC
MTDLRGLPWRMSMEEFFESWIETLAHAVARNTGGIVRAGRANQTVAPISWEPPFRGSQRSLRPDVILDNGDHTIILDAKYKSHGEELAEQIWSLTDEELRARHRADLLQVLAYANLSETSRTTVVLAYPCRAALWDRLREQGRSYHRAEIQAGIRRIGILLVNVPLGTERFQEAAEELSKLLVG